MQEIIDETRDLPIPDADANQREITYIGQSLGRDALVDGTYLFRGGDVAQIGSTRRPIDGRDQSRAANNQGE